VLDETYCGLPTPINALDLTPIAPWTRNHHISWGIEISYLENLITSTQIRQDQRSELSFILEG
jgi:hypothetical protein